jgi:3'-phosphoadenosine 5'-phosphosulfate sulfotransferase (PAPS reductase)/FAD synthetase
MVDFVRGHRDRYDLIEVAPEHPMLDQWREHGTPADILPLEHVEGIDWRSPRLQPWTACCGVHRVGPVLAYISRVDASCALLFGQRQGDGGGTVAGLSTAVPAHVEVALPLWDWSTSDVLAYAAEQGIRLAPHHADCPTSLECTICPANLSREKLDLLDRLYPEDAAFVRQAARHSLSLAAAKANEILAVLDGTGFAARELRR